MTHYESWDIQGWIIISWDFSQFEICGSHVERCVPLQSTCTNPKLCTCGSHVEHWRTTSLSSCVGSLSLLSFISVWGNRLSGALPSTLWTITSLTSLDLSTNLFQSSIPSLIGSLTQLRVFLVLLNSLGGTIPSSLCSIILDISSLRCQFIDWSSTLSARSRYYRSCLFGETPSLEPYLPLSGQWHHLPCWRLVRIHSSAQSLHRWGLCLDCPTFRCPSTDSQELFHPL